ncbi:MAG: biopolymer transporter ExbD [Kiritimatiellia bacterium]|jgi:biopolymer transport protein ExbD|nr:biopolymer transporter ExbD [Kiritimatiellia bacterium]MDP6630109.1 biopolymer transporter ExbD [Kiritimatiellia bacterium]MDP6810610.1 biopolymer transporter ExbD [Kiritimatiellia bacterium]MDP7023695.1 biopolymer transporter ExbD [Kiritimatiellia bacterium]
MRIPVDNSDDAKFVMAPMIDMVFLLLVFFMCASQLSQTQNLTMEIPTATKAVVPRERPDRFVVNIDKDGNLFGGNVPVELADLKNMVLEHKAVNPSLKVYVRADQNTAHKEVRKVMGAMGEAGIDDFIFGAFIPNE